ncbi:MAG: radical SAM protein [Synergistaceae bacterium]|nr:radical SAM protein [Synergistaceae bacterium]
MRHNISMYRPSRYNFFVPLNSGSALAYNSRSGSFAVWDETDRDVYGLIESGADPGRAMAVAGNDRYLHEILENLLKGSYITERDADERRGIEQAARILRYDDSKVTVSIAPTLACNFGCDYCYQSDGARGRAMSGDVQRRVTDFIESRADGKSSLAISWYGGEPLLETDIVCSMSSEFVRFCGERNIGYSSMVVTNGYFLTGDAAKRLLQAGITNAQVTIDGDRSSHDSRRTLRGGGGTYDRILSNVKEAVSDENFSVTVRTNMDMRNKDSIGGMLDDLREEGLCGRKNLSVYFAPVDVCSNECAGTVSALVLSLEEYADAESRASDRAIGLGLRTASLPVRMFSLCQAVKPDGFVFLPDGDVHKCWNTVSDRSERLGTIYDPDSLDRSPLNELWVSGPLLSPECGDCGVLANCAGGCAHKSRNDKLSSPCISLKNNIKEQLVQYALSQKIITRSDLLEGGGRVAVNM